MSSARRPLPGDVVADADDQPFWDACREHRLILQRCSVCGRYYWPAGACAVHGSSHMEWTEASGQGRLHTYTVVYQPYAAVFLELPYNVGVIELDEGPLFHSNVVGCSLDDLKVGMRLSVLFQDLDGGFTLPVFRPAEPM